MAFLGTAINYVDRANLGVALPFLQKDLGLDSAAMGAILGAFFWTYATFQLPSGWFVDRVGPRIAYAAAVIWWSVFTAAGSIARGFASLFACRLLLGAGEAPTYPCNTKVVSEWFPRSERAFATSIFDSGARVGTALSLPIVTGLISTFGWRASFAVTGTLGLVWSVAWLRIYRHPREHRRVSDAELRHIEAESEPAEGQAKVGDVAPVRWRDLFRYRTVWGMMLGFFCLSFVIYFFITWFPTYLVKARGFTLLKLGFLGTIPALVAIPSGYLGGWVSDHLVRRGYRLTWARKIPIVGGMLTSSSIALAVVVPGAGWALALLSLSYASLTFAAASIWSLPADVAPTRRHVASLSGIQNFASNLAGICISSFVGLMLGRTGDKSGGFVTPLLVAGGFSLLGAVSYLFIVGELGPLPAAGASDPALPPPGAAL